MHSKSNNVSNKSIPKHKKMCFTHKRCSPPQLSSSFPRQRQDGGCSHCQCFPSLAPKRWKAVMDSPLKSRSHCTMPLVSVQSAGTLFHVALLLLTSSCLWGLVWDELLSSWLCCAFVPHGHFPHCHHAMLALLRFVSVPAPLPDRFARLHWAQLLSSPRATLSWAMERGGQGHHGWSWESGDSVPAMVCAHPLLPLKPHLMMNSSLAMFTWLSAPTALQKQGQVSSVSP